MVRTSSALIFNVLAASINISLLTPVASYISCIVLVGAFSSVVIDDKLDATPDVFVLILDVFVFIDDKLDATPDVFVDILLVFVFINDRFAAISFDKVVVVLLVISLQIISPVPPSDAVQSNFPH